MYEWDSLMKSGQGREKPALLEVNKVGHSMTYTDINWYVIVPIVSIAVLFD